MIVGIGTDIIEIKRIKKACEKSAFLNKNFTSMEIECFKEKYSQLAGNFSVKEAVAKSFSTGFNGFMPKDIEVLRDKSGKPYVNLYSGALKKAEELNIDKIHISITNTLELAQAFVVCECTRLL